MGLLGLDSEYKSIDKMNMLEFLIKRKFMAKIGQKNWRKDLFEIEKLNNTLPVTYTLEDEISYVFERKIRRKGILKSVL